LGREGLFHLLLGPFLSCLGLASVFSFLPGLFLPFLGRGGFVPPSSGPYFAIFSPGGGWTCRGSTMVYGLRCGKWQISRTDSVIFSYQCGIRSYFRTVGRMVWRKRCVLLLRVEWCGESCYPSTRGGRARVLWEWEIFSMGDDYN
jgi:hypothetical protein